MSELQKAIDRLVSREPGWKRVLPGQGAAQPIGASIGVGKPRTGGMAAGAGEDKVITTSDGIFTLQIGDIR